jgi:hypothetical protein
MKTFLNEERRRKLMEYLLGLNMPASKAIEQAFLPDDVQAVDITMNWHAHHSLKMAEMIVAIGESNPQLLFECATFLSADLATLEIYRDEAQERGISTGLREWFKAASANRVIQ